MFIPPNVSRVMCQVLHVICHFIFYFIFFFIQSGDAYRWRVCYQRGLPRLVSIKYYLCSHECSQCHQSNSAAISEWLLKQWWSVSLSVQYQMQSHNWIDFGHFPPIFCKFHTRHIKKTTCNIILTPTTKEHRICHALATTSAFNLKLCHIPILH